MITTTLDQIKDCRPCFAGWWKLTTAVGNIPGNKEFPLADIFRTNGVSDFLWVVCHLEPRLATAFALRLVKLLPDASEAWKRELLVAESHFREGGSYSFPKPLPRNSSHHDTLVKWALRVVESCEKGDPGMMWSDLGRIYFTENALELDDTFKGAAPLLRGSQGGLLAPLLTILNSVDEVTESDILSLLD